MARVRNRQAGFTLIEIMAVVVILGILAIVAIPMFTEQARKGKSNSEIMAFFGELGTKQEQYKVDKGVYLTTAACPATTGPTALTVSTCTAIGGAWAPLVTNTLNVQPPTAEAFCSYTMTAGTGTGTGNVTVAGSTFTFTSPAGNWYYIVGQCDLDGDGTPSVFFTNSVDSTIQKSITEDE